jgi:hypothetical protein
MELLPTAISIVYTYVYFLPATTHSYIYSLYICILSIRTEHINDISEVNLWGCHFITFRATLKPIFALSICQP